MNTGMKIVGHGTKIGRKQEDAIAALLTQPTLAEAARQTGVGEKTLRRWQQDPSFQSAYREARRTTFGRAQQAADT